MFPALRAVIAFGLVRCDLGDASSCLIVSPDESFVLSGTAMSTSFTPESRSYSVRNTCREQVELSVEEDVRWLDVEIAAFGGVDEFGPLAAGESVSVDIEIRYGLDDAERLDQLSPGEYEVEIRFVDDTNETEVIRGVELMVSQS